MEPQDHPAMVAARTGKRAAQIIGFLDEESNKTRWIQAKSIPEYLPGDQNPFRILTTITDITKLQENLQAEQKLSQSLKEDVVRIDQEFSRLSHLHQTILENAGLAILFADPDGIIQYINPAMERMTGYAQHEFISKKIHVSCLTDPAEIVSISEKLTGKPNLTNHEVREALDIYMEGQTTEWTLITKHKATLPVKVNLSLLKNDEGGLLGGIFIYMDISNEKEILQTLRESEARFTRMFMDHDAIMLLIDPATLEIIKANESAKTFYGYNFEEESKIKINQLNQIPTEDLQNKMQAALTLVNQCFIFKHTLHNGEVRIVEVHSSPIETNDKTVLFSIIHDVTDRETIREQLSESEARWNFALEGAGEGVWDWNMSTGEVFYSDQWKKLLGYEKNEINGDLSEWETRIHPADLEICMSNLREHIFGNTEHYFNEHRAITKNGTTIWVLDRGKVIQRLKDGTPVRMICATKDITSQKILEKTLVDTIEKEKELNTLKSRFISMASHEFRTPLATIMASSESVSSYWGKMTSEQREGKHHKIREQVMRLSQFVEKMLQLSKLQNSEHLIDIEHFELNEFLHKVTEDIKLLVNGTHQIILDLPGDELWINSDRNALTMIINNLLTNSIKYSAPGTEIIIDLAKVDNQYLISITDQGVGIPEQEQKHLFTPFFRASNSGHVSGTGLGLNIVKENTEKLGGTINLTSKINKGTAVTITIPINPEPSAEKLKLTYEEDSHR
jgi:PAS domain S-box-containing protein